MYFQKITLPAVSVLFVDFFQFRTNASRGGILIEAISSLKNEEVLALCSGHTYFVQFVA